MLSWLCPGWNQHPKASALQTVLQLISFGCLFLFIVIAVIVPLPKKQNEPHEYLISLFWGVVFVERDFKCGEGKEPGGGDTGQLSTQ